MKGRNFIFLTLVFLISLFGLFFSFGNYVFLQRLDSNLINSQSVSWQDTKSIITDAKLNCWNENNQDIFPDIEPLVISQNRLLISKCDTLFLLDENRKLVWRKAVGAPLTTQPIVDSTGTLIYALALDLNWVALDVKTGDVKWNNGGNGKAVYSQLKAYKDDTYLVVVNMAGYDDKYSVCAEGETLTKKTNCHRTIPDSLYLSRGKEIIWEKKFPADAQLKVWNNKILAVWFVNDEMKITEIK
jgi:outer membrane protein assembly factor BamB